MTIGRLITLLCIAAIAGEAVYAARDRDVLLVASDVVIAAWYARSAVPGIRRWREDGIE